MLLQNNSVAETQKAMIKETGVNIKGVGMGEIKEVGPHILLHLLTVHAHSLRADLPVITRSKDLFPEIKQGQGFRPALRGLINDNDIKKARFRRYGFIHAMQRHNPDRDGGSAGIEMATGIFLMGPGVPSGSFAELLHGLLPGDHVRMLLMGHPAKKMPPGPRCCRYPRRQPHRNLLETDNH